MEGGKEHHMMAMAEPPREANAPTTMKKKGKEKEKAEKKKQKETAHRTAAAAAAAKKQSSSSTTTDPASPSYRMALKNYLFSCRSSHASLDGKRCKKLGCSASICNLRDHPRVMQRPEAASPDELCKRRASVSACGSGPAGGGGGGGERCIKKPLSDVNGAASSLQGGPGGGSSSSSSSTGGSFRGMHLRRLSGCYECHMVVDASMRATICSCPDCGEIFVRAESLELHQSIRHAVSELGPEDTSRNIIEIIFQSSWLKKQTPVCKIDRILKVQHTARTLARFEEYRDSVKSRAGKLGKKYPRCTADGNELLRFHCAALGCSLGLNGGTNLCDGIPSCAACGIIRDGFKTGKDGAIRTMATSGRAHDATAGAAAQAADDRRAMLVCRVIAGRVRRSPEAASDEYDSVAGSAGLYSNLDELSVSNPRAILPCFVVIYRA